MYAVEIYAAVRQFVFVEGRSRREAASVFGLSRDTISKMCRFSVPPGYVRSKPPGKPKLGPLLPVIDAILAADVTAPPKQRHTAQRIFERLKTEHGFSGGYTVVKDYVRIAKGRSRETFVPLAHPPGHAQVDFGEAIGVIGGVRRKLHVFFMDVPHSDALFMKAYPAETTEAFLDGHVSAFSFFGGIPLSILYDNTKLAVARICGDGKRERTRAFTELVSHYLFRDRFGRPGKGNDKGKVEGLVKNGRRRFLTPVPVAESFEDLNARLEAACLADLDRRASGRSETIGARLEADLAVFRPLPSGAFEACEKRTARVSSTSLVRYRTSDYSVPATYGFRDVVVKGFVDQVVIICDGEEIARHKRSHERSAFVCDPLHYLALIEQKPGALDQARPLQGWPLPEQFEHLRRLLEARMGNRGKREFIQSLPPRRRIGANIVLAFWNRVRFMHGMPPESLLNELWSGALTRLGGSAAIEACARQTGAFLRPRAVKTACDLLRLVLAYCLGGMGLRSTSAWAASVQLADLSNVALLKRLRNCEAWLEHLVGQLLGGEPAAHGRRIRLIDGTTVPKASRTAKQNNGLWRLHCAFDLPAERFSFFALTDEKGGEQLDRTPVAAGDILIADRGFMHPERLAHVCEQGADIVVRAGWKGARWLDGKGKPFDLLAALAAAANAGVLDCPIWIGRKKAPPLALRLVAFRKPAAAAEISRAKARRAAQREGNAILGGTLAAAEWVILVTSLKAEAWSSAEIGDLYRARWRIEMAFKRLKSILGLEGPPGEDPKVAKTWILAHLRLVPRRGRPSRGLRKVHSPNLITL